MWRAKIAPSSTRTPFDILDCMRVRRFSLSPRRPAHWLDDALRIILLQTKILATRLVNTFSECTWISDTFRRISRPLKSIIFKLQVKLLVYPQYCMRVCNRFDAACGSRQGLVSARAPIAPAPWPVWPFHQRRNFTSARRFICISQTWR